MRALIGCNAPDQLHLRPPSTHMGPGAPFKLSLSPSLGYAVGVLVCSLVFGSASWMAVRLVLLVALSWTWPSRVLCMSPVICLTLSPAAPAWTLDLVCCLPCLEMLMDSAPSTLWDCLTWMLPLLRCLRLLACLHLGNFVLKCLAWLLCALLR